MSYQRKKKRKAPAKRKRGIAGAITGFFWGLFKAGFQIAVLASAILAAVIYYFSTTLPPFDELRDARHGGGSVTFLDRNNEIFAWRGQQFDGTLRASNASKYLIDAVIATEDKRFYNHFGISPRGIVGAMQSNYQKTGNPFKGAGGSTITVQLAKLLCLGKPYDPNEGTIAEYEAECRRGTVERKLKEMVYAMALELKFNKEEILTLYLNRAYLGASTFGFGAASKRYFDIPAQGLDIPQSAMLAGMLTAPSRFAPTNNLERSQDRAATVIRLMLEQGYITEEQAQAAWDNPAQVSARAVSDEGIFFADWLMKDQPDYLTSETGEDFIFRTTFDPRIQKWAQAAIDKIFDTKVKPGSKAQAAIVVMEKTGAVRAMIGGRFDEDRVEQGFNRAVDAQRQPGSSFKPFVYAAALEKGMKPYQKFVDGPITIRIRGGADYNPRNYAGGYAGTMSLADALKKSVNTIAVDLQQRAGTSYVQTVSKELGIKSPMPGVPSLALGSAEMNLLEMVTAYAGIYNRGVPVTPFGWTEMGFKTTQETLQVNSPKYGPRVLSDEKAGWLIWMMKGVVDGGTGQRARINGVQVAGKTGTTSSYKDAWFIGFAGDYITGVWMGYDDNTPLTGVTGGGLPADIWREAMTPIVKNLGAGPLPMTVPQAPAPPPPPQPAPQPEQNLIDELLNLLQ